MNLECYCNQRVLNQREMEVKRDGLYFSILQTHFICLMILNQVGLGHK